MFCLVTQEQLKSKLSTLNDEDKKVLLIYYKFTYFIEIIVFYISINS